MGISTNSMDARAFGQPGGFFDSLTNGLNRAVGAWSGARDRQDERDFNQQVLTAKLGNERADKKERTDNARLDRAMRFAKDAGTYDPTGLTPEQSTAIEKVAAVTRQDRARTVQDRQTSDQQVAARLAALGFDPGDMGYDMVPGSEQFKERAHQVAAEHAAQEQAGQAERYAHGVEGTAKAMGLLRRSMGITDPNMKPVTPIVRDFETGDPMGTKKTLMYDPKTGQYVLPNIAPGALGQGMGGADVEAPPMAETESPEVPEADLLNWRRTLATPGTPQYAGAIEKLKRWQRGIGEDGKPSKALQQRAQTIRAALSADQGSMPQTVTP